MKRQATLFENLSACALVCLLWLWPVVARAQIADDCFAPNPNHRVDVIALQPDGKVLIAGLFSAVGDENAGGFARLHADGTLDDSFEPPQIFGGFSPIHAIAVQPDGRIIIAGFFKTPAPFSRTNIMRLLPDGSVDTTFVADTDNTVESLLLLPDGRLFVGGYFRSVNGTARTNIVLLHTNGAIDTAFTVAANGGVLSLVAQSDGRVLLSGQFTQLGGFSRHNIARLNADGSVDAAYDPGVILDPSANDAVTRLTLQADGRCVVSGFMLISNTPLCRALLRFHADGSPDNGFPTITNGTVGSVALQADGRILVAGQFTEIGSQSWTNLIRLMPDGSVDASFAPMVQSGSSPLVRALAVQSDGKIIVGGLFTNLAGASRTNLGRLMPDGRAETVFDPGLPGMPFSLAVQQDGGIIVGGLFTQIAGVPRTNIARLLPGGAIDPSFYSGASPVGENLWVNTLLLQDDGKIVVGGAFSMFAGQPRVGIARLNADGTADPGFNPGAGQPPSPGRTIYNLALQPDGKIIVGGNFFVLDGRACTNIGRLHPNGSLDASFSSGADSWVRSILVQPDGKLIVAGRFATIGGIPRARIARLNADGSVDPAFNPGANGEVVTLALQADGKILVGGYFTQLGTSFHGRIGRLHNDGTVDESFNPYVSYDDSDDDPCVAGIAVQADGRIWVGGCFDAVSGAQRLNIALLEPSGSGSPNDFMGATGSGPISPIAVRALAIQGDGEILCGGLFNAIGGAARTNLARLSNPTAATQSLALDSSGVTVTWWRGGSAPELQHVSFALSLDGTNFTSFTPPNSVARINGGWRAAAPAVPEGQAFYLRARGRSSGGWYTSSGGLFESTAQFWRLPPPFLNQLQVLGKGQFQFSFTNTNAVAFTVLASTNATAPLTQWESLGSPLPSGFGFYQFTDAGATNYTRRFYQLRSP